MKIQDLAIIFIIIILPISIVLSIYTQFQIQTLNLQTLYDTKLTSATYDAIKAFQINTANSTMSELSNSKMRDIEASVATFKNSIMSTFGLNGYTEEDLDNYIPALVYTMYDGFYIYSPYENTNYLYEYKRDASGNIEYDASGNPKYETVGGEKVPIDNNEETIYGLKPYITYSCRYDNGSVDIVITYSLDNFITITGTINGKYVSDEGYLIDGITQDVSGNIFYNGVQIKAEEELKEYVINENGVGRTYPYIKLNGTKYYYDDGNGNANDARIFYISNGTITTQGDYKGAKATQYYNDVMKYNSSAIKYYKKAMEFTKRVKNEYGLGSLEYQHAYEMEQTGATYTKTKLWNGDTRKIFVFNDSGTGTNIENELSNYNQHRLAVIRHKIEENLSIAISNYNKYSDARGTQFEMPELKEEEWNLVMDNISLISFVQGLNIGGKIYNGYTIVNNSESKEVVQEENIYILGKDNYYHRIGDNYLTIGNGSNITTTIPAGRLNLDFKRKSTIVESGTTSETLYYYPLKTYNASYSSIVTQNDVTTYDDIYAYIQEQKNGGNVNLASAFYTALGRERESSYKFSNESAFNYNVLVVGYTSTTSYESVTRSLTNKLNEYDGISATYIFSDDATYLSNYIQSQRNNYKVIIIDSFVWSFPNTTVLEQIAKSTNVITISNDAYGLPMFQSVQLLSGSITMTPQLTTLGNQKLGTGKLGTSNKFTDGSQRAIKFNTDVEVLCKGTYSSGIAGSQDIIGFWKNGTHNWIHSQFSFNYTNGNEMDVLAKLVDLAMNGL